jgi:uncharacterized protein DUF742
MTPRHAGQDDGERLIRPFVESLRRPVAGPWDSEVAILRPFLLTAGRVVPIDRTLEIEAQVVATQLGRASYQNLAFEQRDIVLLCHAAMSVAEVAARLEYHVGVARVLIADLAASGHLAVRRPDTKPALDLAMIERVIRGLEAIP